MASIPGTRFLQAKKSFATAVLCRSFLCEDTKSNIYIYRHKLSVSATVSTKMFF